MIYRRESVYYMIWDIFQKSARIKIEEFQPSPATCRDAQATFNCTVDGTDSHGH